jgi:putative effector of murein hydrolase LrgA (UPF0299 family)
MTARTAAALSVATMAVLFVGLGVGFIAAAHLMTSAELAVRDWLR